MTKDNPNKLKVKNPATIKDLELPLLPRWEGIINRPTTLEALDSNAQQAIDDNTAEFLTLGDLARLDQITETEITNNAVTTPKIFAGAVTSAKITTGEFITLSAQIKNAIIQDAHFTGVLSVGKTEADITQTTIDGGLITTGYITLNTAGHIKSGKTSYADTTAGWWLGKDGTIPKFNIGNAINYMKWDGSAVTVSGNIIIKNPITVRTDINVANGADVTGSNTAANASNYTGSSISTGYTAAKCTDAAADQTSVNTAYNASNYTGNVISSAYIGNLTAAKITSGTITIGGASQPSNLTVVESSSGGAGGTTSKLQWKSSGGTLRAKIWADSSGYMGYNAIGGRHYFYTANNENVIIGNGVQTIFNQGISCRDGFNITSGYNARIANGYFYFDASSTKNYITATSGSTWISAQTGNYVYLAINGTARLKVSDAGITMYSTDSMPQLLTNWIRKIGSAPQIGSSADKWVIYCNGLSACPLPITTTALSKLKKTSHKKLEKGVGHYGDEIDYLDIPEAPAEIKTIRKNKETGKDEEDIDIIKTTAFLYSCLKELQEEIELLKK